MESPSVFFTPPAAGHPEPDFLNTNSQVPQFSQSSTDGPQHPETLVPGQTSDSLFSMGAPTEFLGDAGISPELAQMGMAVGKQAFGSSVAKAQGTINQYVSVQSIKYYFNVNTAYVLQKLRLLVFPWATRSWTRQMDRMGDQPTYLPPKSDLQAPDLYIPLMAAVTYVLLVGFVKGLQQSFDPEVLGRMMSRALVAMVLEVLLLKLGLYLMPNAYNAPLLDLLAYSGYLFVGITGNIFIGFCAGVSAYYVALICNSLAMGFFMFKTCNNLLTRDATAGAIMSSPVKLYFLVSVAILQLVMAWFLGVGLTAGAIDHALPGLLGFGRNADGPDMPLVDTLITLPEDANALAGNQPIAGIEDDQPLVDGET